MRFRISFLIFIQSIALVIALHAQDSSVNTERLKEMKGNHYLAISPTLTWVHYKDYVNSPLTYNSSGFPIGLEMSYENRSKLHSGYSRIFFTNQSLNTEVAPTNANPDGVGASSGAAFG